MENGEKQTGNRKRAVENGKQKAGNRKRKKANGKKEGKTERESERYKVNGKWKTEKREIENGN